MPRVMFRGLSVEQMCRISTELTRELAEICECGEDNFTLEHLNPVTVFAGEIVQSYPFVEVAWFERGTNVRNRVAEAITAHLVRLGCSEVEVAFITYTPEAYYIDGHPQG